MWDEPERLWDITIGDREAGLLAKATVKNNTSWVAAKAREVAGLHKALSLDWPPRDDETGE